jgi:Niemann-Pick C1 protein
MQCRSSLGGPTSPDLVLGGFPVGPAFRNYSADATAFVVTYPIGSHEANRLCLASHTTLAF